MVALVVLGVIVGLAAPRGGELAVAVVLVATGWAAAAVAWTRVRRASDLQLRHARTSTEHLLAGVLSWTPEGDAALAVAELGQVVGNQLGMSGEALHELYLAGALHRLGEAAIPESIRDKSGRLTEDEWNLMKKVPIESQYIVDRIGHIPSAVAEIVRSCHERWDGRGYPDGLSGTRIPLAARIIGCSGAYIAMTRDRPYRRALAAREALEEIEANAGTQFDPVVASALISVIDRFDRRTPFERAGVDRAGQSSWTGRVGAASPSLRSDE